MNTIKLMAATCLLLAVSVNSFATPKSTVANNAAAYKNVTLATLCKLGSSKFDISNKVAGRNNKSSHKPNIENNTNYMHTKVSANAAERCELPHFDKQASKGRNELL